MTERLDREVRRSVLSSGTVVLSERMDSVRSVAAGVWVRRGTAHEQPEYRGIAHLLEHMVFKGTSRRSAQEIAAAVEGTGGSLDAYTTHEHTSFQVRVPSDHLGTGLDVLADLAFSPALRAEDLDLEREVVLEEISRMEETPDDLALRVALGRYRTAQGETEEAEIILKACFREAPRRNRMFFAKPEQRRHSCRCIHMLIR